MLALNPGSSSLKAALRTPELALVVSVERLGTPEGQLAIISGPHRETRSFGGGLAAAADAIAHEIAVRGLQPDAVSHRVVHGGPNHFRPSHVDDSLLDSLRSVIPLAPLHLPGDLDSIDHARRVWPDAEHVACFDTGFHHDLPEVSRRLPVPERLVRDGIRRYGFHGLSVQSVLHARPDLDDLVVAHLGSGCSASAVANGKSRHTTMSLTPTGGMVSATRTGDLDPEIPLYLLEHKGYGLTELRQLLDHESGIAGIAEGRHDLRDLLGASDASAQLAIAVFVASAARAITDCALALDSWRNLVFTGGIGQNSEAVRELICQRLLSVRGAVRSSSASAVQTLVADGVSVIVVPADEEGVLDRLARELLWPS